MSLTPERIAKRYIDKPAFNWKAADSVKLARAYLVTLAELQAAQERETESALRERGALEERDAWRQTAREAADQRDAAQEREKALRWALERIASNEAFGSAGTLGRGWADNEARQRMRVAREALAVQRTEEAGG